MHYFRKSNLKNLPTKAVLVLLSFVLFVIGVYISIYSVAFDTNQYEIEFEKYDIAESMEIEKSELSQVMQKMISYLAGDADSMQSYKVYYSFYKVPYFTDGELKHMQDVRGVFHFGDVVFYVMLGLYFACMVFLLLIKKNNIEKNIGFFNKSTLALILITLFIGLMFSIDFNQAFENFHKIFFPQGNYTFPWSSNLIKMLPIELFTDFVTIIIVNMASYLICIYGGTKVLKKFVQEKKKANKFLKLNNW